jgi:3-mercaptopyruvate sulfurtransferase SseA
VALQLKRAGIQQVRPLAGGFEAWRDLGFALEPTGEIAAASYD